MGKGALPHGDMQRARGLASSPKRKLRVLIGVSFQTNRRLLAQM